MAHKQNVHVCNFDELISQPSQVGVQNCDGSTTTQTVEQVVGAYLINQHHYTQKEVYDVVTATFGGQLTGTIAGTTLTLGFALVTATNDSPLGYLIDFGTGFTDIIAPTATSVQDFANQPAGKYEAKVYAVTSSGNIIIFQGIELNWTGTVLTFLTTMPANVNRSYRVLVNTFLQAYCDNLPVGQARLADGTAYALTGTRSLTLPVIRDERFSEADVTLSGGTMSAPVAVTPVYSTNRTLQTANTTPAAYNVPAIANSREITVQNLTNSDVQITTSQGTQIVATRGVITLANPNNTTVNHNVFTGNITVTFLSNVGGNIGGIAPRVIINQKGY